MLTVRNDLDAKAVDMAGALDIGSLPSLSLDGLCRLPRLSAVYFVVLNGRVLYIGATANLRDRWRDHLQMPVLRKGGHVAWLLIERWMLVHVERAMIYEFSPPMNNHHTEPGRGMKGVRFGAADYLRRLKC